MKRAARVLVVIPAYNEQHSIGKVLEEISHLYPHVDMLVVDDGSTDATAQIAKEKGSRVISHSANLGYTAALQTGRIHALDTDYDYLVFVDADGQHQPSDMSRVLEPLVSGEADQVRGSRVLGKYEGAESPHLRMSRWICSRLVSFKVRGKVTDATSGLKAENRKVTQYFMEMYKTSKKIHASNTNDIEEHLIAYKQGFKLTEVPVIMQSRVVGSTKCYSTRQLLIFPMDLIRTFLRNL